MNKNTNDLLEELKTFSNFKEFIEENKEMIADVSVSEYINALIEKKGLIKSQIVKKSQLNEIYAYHIISGIKKNPQRSKLLCLAFAMELTFDEVQEMLKKCGYSTLYAKNPFDCVVIYGLCNSLSLIDTNELLFDNGLETLG